MPPVNPEKIHLVNEPDNLETPTVTEEDESENPEKEMLLLDADQKIELTFEETTVISEYFEHIKEAAVALFKINHNPFRNEHILVTSSIYYLNIIRNTLEGGVVPVSPEPFPDYTEDWSDYLQMLQTEKDHQESCEADFEDDE